MPSAVGGGEPSAVGTAVSGDEAVFALVVETFSRLVFSTALRQLGGDAESAREVTQNVFLTAFRKQDILAGVKFPAAWFHRAAMLESSNFLRVESRRRKHLEAWAAEQSVVHDEASAGLSEVLRAQLDEALHGLREPDRELVLGRFFEGRSFQELAERHRSTPDAVRMKLARILDKLSTVLKRRGVAVTITALASALGSQWSQAAPAGLGAAVAAASKTGTTLTASKLNLLITAMTSGKTLFFSLMLLLFMLLSLQFQSGRIDHLKTALNERAGAAGEPHPLSRPAAPGNAAKPGGPGKSGRQPEAESGPVTAVSLLNAIRNEIGWTRGQDGTFLNTKVDDRLAVMSSQELLELLAEMDQSPGGAGIKSRARSHLIEQFLARKNPEEALRQAIRYRMSDTTFLNIARRGARTGNGEAIEAAMALLKDPAALPAVKFGSDPAAALRQGIAGGLAVRDGLPAAFALCREAAGTPAAADYLLGLTYSLCGTSDRDTVFDLLAGVPDPAGRSKFLKALAVEMARQSKDDSARAFFSDARFPGPLRREVVLEAATSAYDDVLFGVSNALNLIDGGSGDGDRLELTTSWLRQNEAPASPAGRMTPVESENEVDAITEKSLRLAATQDPALAGKWLNGIRNPQRRDAISRELNLSVP